VKTCSKCQQTKSRDDFPNRKNRADGKLSWCKDCVSANNKAYHAAHAERIRAQKRAFRADNPELAKERVARWADKNRDKLNTYYREYAKRNPHKKQVVTVARRAQKLQATPSWANHRYIALFYEMVRLESERLGVEVHVDHIVPLKNSRVCGLHCEHNLQLLVASANLTKSNRVWPDM